jgi:hypothetical protein
LKQVWQGSWTTSPRRERNERIDDTFPFDGYRKRQYKLSREHASLLVQVRSSHLPLNKRAESKRCQACQINPGDETPTENIEHFIYNCEAYTGLRQILFRNIGASNIALKDIMLNTKHMKALAQYIMRTGRLKNEGAPAPGQQNRT